MRVKMLWRVKNDRNPSLTETKSKFLVPLIIKYIPMFNAFKPMSLYFCSYAIS